MSGAHDDHDHDHDHNHDHDSALELGVQYSLYSRIDFQKTECLNEKTEGSGITVFKAWENRLDTEKFVESDVDEELLFNITFMGGEKLEKTTHLATMYLEGGGLKQICQRGVSAVRKIYAELLKPAINHYYITGMRCMCFTARIKLKGLIVVGGEGESHPSCVRLYKNRPHMAFDDVLVEPEQVFELHPDNTGVIEYPIKVVKFSSVTHLALYFPRNFGAETTKIYYIGLKGEYLEEIQRRGVVICNYEVRPSVADHKTDMLEQMGREIQ